MIIKHGGMGWMLEYAIVPPAIAVMSSLIMFYFKGKSSKSWYIGFLILAFITTIAIFMITQEYQKIKWEKGSKNVKVPLSLVVAVVSTSFTLIWIYSLITFFIFKFSRVSYFIKMKLHSIFDILIMIFIVIIITRWLWGPFAFINYYNTWIVPEGRKPKDYKLWFLVYMIPIVFKSLIEIPFYSLLTYSLLPIIRIIKNKIYFYSSREYTF
ncbi:hypothetical protein PT313_01650 [Metamycoplasma hyosynoviae]|uniref:Uncharacterized protein n=1 Tax=Metamycoplasma hyosynoviae TaxID=29559 RepID=A0A9Q9BZ14_9BACT|nr:hypothetical protein [Metamycoplasma hyosynoviae]MDC8899991.1 hypothetical protein [Metamycoplasma hyosynoviae]MDC8913703.1 hypothetical protein [Metamycoplasma hyosynoviae]MDC8916278.1 hypothetical protein [Metamycoplasma hyosynoviae]MDC8917600.1 hypothetical protein [Metamycoplasma hyosynoviae]MDC8919607.1 hypothetical protein [Metamycoplasma hyosynoviae]